MRKININYVKKLVMNSVAYILLMNQDDVSSKIAPDTRENTREKFYGTR